MQDKHIIVTESFVRGLHRKLIVGWIVAMVVSVVLISAYAGLYFKSLHDIRKVKDEFVQLENDIKVVMAEQRRVSDTYVTAWENQQKTADLLLTWGSYVKERKDLVSFNKSSVAVKSNPNPWK